MRARAWALATLVIMADLLGACGAAGRAQTDLHGAAPSKIRRPPAGRYCVMGHSWTLQEKTLRVGHENVPLEAKNALIDAAEQAAADAGATCARVEIQASFIWGGTRGALSGEGANFSRYDYIATHLAQHGIALVPVILQYGGSRIQTTSGRNRAFTSAYDYGTYAGTVARWIADHNGQMAAQRLPQITRVELMNEPNQSYWFAQPNDPATIADFLKAGYSAVKSVDRELFVFAPGLANGGHSHSNLFLVLRGLYQAGCKAGTCWDGLSVHNFAWAQDPDDYHGADFENQWQNYRGVETIAAANGDAGIKLCLTETGFTTAGPLPETPAAAAAHMDRAYALAYQDPQIACIVNASIWDGDDGGGPFGALGLGRLEGDKFVPNERYAVFEKWANPRSFR